MQSDKWLTEEIKNDAQYLAHEIGESGIDQRVLDAMDRVPRHKFVPFDSEYCAYDDIPLSIGYGQTISQPSLVALMTHMLRLDSSSIVLEIGTGSGYQAAILAELAKQVYTIEIVDELAYEADMRLHSLGYTNIKTRSGNGYMGWEEYSPYDAICVTASAPHIPSPLTKQLNINGRMIIPLGNRLLLITKDKNGHLSERQLCDVLFVPLTGVPGSKKRSFFSIN
jgi:protein-L-isoaspartate(D-aspartate) O-methyltransferase